jgi:hypothetical protein
MALRVFAGSRRHPRGLFFAGGLHASLAIASHTVPEDRPKSTENVIVHREW